MRKPLDTDQYLPHPITREAAAERLAVLVPAAYVDVVWDELLAPLYDARQASVHWQRGSCRHCHTPHPAQWSRSVGGRAGRPWPGHRMSCPQYVGPLEHKNVGGHQQLMGWATECSCGQSYLDDAWDRENCPDAAVDWRGPRPEAPDA